MNRGFGFFLAVPIFFIGVFAILAIGDLRDENESFKEYVLSLQVDYSTDAATAELLKQVDIGYDYQNWGRVDVDPDTALDVFTKVMCINYDLPMTDKAIVQMQGSYFPVFCVAAYNGYYIYERIEDDNGDWHMNATPKIPYTYYKDTTGEYYALNLGLENCYMLKNGKLTLEQLSAHGIASTEASYYINSCVSDDLMYRYQQLSQKGNPNVNAVYLPMGLATMSQVNAIEGPSVIAIVDNWDLQSAHELSAFSIGGAKIEPSRMVAGYKRADGVMYYCYADLLPTDPSGNVQVAIDNLFTSVVEAAKQGYYPDPYYMLGG